MSEDFISEIIKDIGKLYTKDDDREAFILEFENVIEHKVNDYPLTANEINTFWLLLKKYNRTDAVHALAYKILLEKLLIFSMEKRHLNDRHVLRVVFNLYPVKDDEPEAEENKGEANKLLKDLLENREVPYLMNMIPKITAFLNSFYFYQLNEIDPEAKDAFDIAYHILKAQSNSIINAEGTVRGA